jgi:hypothetical protein
VGSAKIDVAGDVLANADARRSETDDHAENKTLTREGEANAITKTRAADGTGFFFLVRVNVFVLQIPPMSGGP